MSVEENNLFLFVVSILLCFHFFISLDFVESKHHNLLRNPIPRHCFAILEFSTPRQTRELFCIIDALMQKCGG